MRLRSSHSTTSPLVASALALVAFGVPPACGDDDGAPDAETEPDASAANDAGPVAPADAATSETCAARDVPCVDTSVETLDLFDVPSDGAITEEGDGAGFLSFIDATAGGLMASESFVYARFTDDGLARVDVSDEDAFVSSDWDVAFRRYVIRLNSGVSGPSCVLAGRTAPGTRFDDLTAVPDGLALRTEEYFVGDSCELVSDGSGIGAPATALGSFWSYSACVQMTGNVYVVQTAGGRHVKLQVLSYYTPENQAVCDESGMVPMPSGAGNLRIRWDFLD